MMDLDDGQQGVMDGQKQEIKQRLIQLRLQDRREQRPKQCN